MFRKRRIPKVKPEVNCLKTEAEPIDLVITWVNGSDPAFKEEQLLRPHANMSTNIKCIDQTFANDEKLSRPVS